MRYEDLIETTPEYRRKWLRKVTIVQKGETYEEGQFKGGSEYYLQLGAYRKWSDWPISFQFKAHRVLKRQELLKLHRG